MITIVCNPFTLISVSCLHFGQNNGKFSSTVSGRIFIRVLLLQTGHNTHSIFDKCFSPPVIHYFCKFLSTRQLGIFYSLLNLRNSTNKAITNIHSTIKSVIATEKAENIQPTINEIIGIAIEKTQ